MGWPFVLQILSASAILSAGIALAVAGFWLLRSNKTPVAASIDLTDMTGGELALAWGICAAPLGLILLIGDRGFGTAWLRWAALLFLAVGVICAVSRRMIYGRWR